MILENFENLGQLKKLTITAKGQKFEVMFNPESYSRTFYTLYRKRDSSDSKVAEYDYKGSEPEHFKLKLLIDGTGVSSLGGPLSPLLGMGETSVYDKVQEFLELTCKLADGKPNDLVIKWGKLELPCRLTEATVNYTLFTMEGDPLRAELDTDFIIIPDTNTGQKAVVGGKASGKASAGVANSSIASQPTPPNATVSNGIVINVS